MQGCKHELVLERSHEPQTGQLIQTLVFALRFDDDGMLHKEANATLQVAAELYNQHVAVGLAAWCMVRSRKKSTTGSNVKTSVNGSIPFVALDIEQ